PAHRPRAGPVSSAGGSPGGGVLASQGLDGLPDAHRLHARAAAGRRVSGGERPGADGRGAVATVGPPREVRREHVSHQDPGRAGVRHQADELPRPHPDLQARTAQLPGASIRLAEFGKVHRYEPSGALHGLMRVRAFTQDDAHIFITEQQITEESVAVTKLLLDIYRDFGFDDVRIKFADRPPKRVGSDEVWDRAEAALKAASLAAGIEYTLNPGEGAFYGPKLEFVLRDAIGRDWQCGTIQVDLNLPGRLGAYYIDEHSAK